MGPLTKATPHKLFLNIIGTQFFRGESQSDFLETTWEEMAGMSLYMDWFRS